MTMFVLLCQVQHLALLLADWLLLLIRAEPGACFGAQLIQSPFIGLGPLYHLQSRITLTLFFIVPSRDPLKLGLVGLGPLYNLQSRSPAEAALHCAITQGKTG